MPEDCPLRPPSSIKSDIVLGPMVAALSRMDYGFMLTGPDRAVHWCNAAFTDTQMPQGEPEAAIGRPFEEVLGDVFPVAADWERVLAAYDEARQHLGWRQAVETLTHSGEARLLRMLNLVLHNLDSEASPPGAPRGWVGWFFFDLTGYQTSPENLRTLLRQASDGIFLIDPQCRPLVFNPACERITGYNAVDVLHRREAFEGIFPELADQQEYAPPDRPRTFVRDASGMSVNMDLFRRASQPSFLEETQIATRSGERKWVEIGYAPIFDDQNNITYVIGIIRDTTSRREMENQLRLTRKLATLGELTSAMAHEIKNPLGIILSASEILLNPNRPAEQKDLAAGFIREESKRLDERIKVFLQFSRPKPPEFKVQNIHRALTQTIIAYQTLAREGLNLETHFAMHLAHVRVDADQMQQVFLNLLMNADQAMPLGGMIRIFTRAVDEGRAVEIEIADEGEGVPETEKARLFEPFYTTRESGTGLGLSIVMHILHAHHAQIRAINREDGSGASFYVTLPAADRGSDATGDTDGG